MSDWGSDVCSSDLRGWTYAKFLLGNERTSMASTPRSRAAIDLLKRVAAANPPGAPILRHPDFARKVARAEIALRALEATEMAVLRAVEQGREPGFRSEEHTSELRSLMRNSYA